MLGIGIAFFNEYMFNTRGRITKIKAAEECYYELKGISNWYYNEEMLEPER